MVHEILFAESLSRLIPKQRNRTFVVDSNWRSDNSHLHCRTGCRNVSHCRQQQSRNNVHPDMIILNLLINWLLGSNLSQPLYAKRYHVAENGREMIQEAHGDETKCWEKYRCNSFGSLWLRSPTMYKKQVQFWPPGSCPLGLARLRRLSNGMTRLGQGWFSYDLEMKTREQNRNNKRTEREDSIGLSNEYKRA